MCLKYFRAVLAAVLGGVLLCLLMRGTATAIPKEDAVRAASEEGCIVQEVPGLSVRVQGRDGSSPAGREVFADTYLHLFRQGQPLAEVRIYGDQCRISTRRIGDADWYSVESCLNVPGMERSAMSLVSPAGLVVNLFDDDRVGAVSTSPQGGGLSLRWKSEYEEEPGRRSVYSHDALVGKNAIRIRSAAGLESTFDWTDLRVVTARFVRGAVVDGTTCQLFFETRDGGQLNMLTLGRGWLDWLNSNRGRRLTITYGTCRYDREMDSGSGLFLYNAIPAHEGMTK